MTNLDKLYQFARLHDWGENAKIANGKVWVDEITVCPNGKTTSERVGFSNLWEMRNWAGY